MPFGQFNDLVLHFEDDGPTNAPAVVFANSLGTDLRIWDEVVARLSTKLRVLRYDLRGHGLSEAPPAPYSLDDHVGDLAALMDARGVSDALIVGLSVGGMIAMALASRRADLARALVLCDTAHKIGTREMWDQRIAAVRQGGLVSIADQVLQRWFAAAFHRTRPADLAGYRNMLTRTPVEGYAGTCATVRDADLTGVVGELGLPVLCLVGDEDGATPPDLVEDMARRIPSSSFQVIGKCGHIPCLERPEELVQLISAFILKHVKENFHV
jgi:3-oxoadipate enol-lactonase